MKVTSDVSQCIYGQRYDTPPVGWLASEIRLAEGFFGSFDELWAIFDAFVSRYHSNRDIAALRSCLSGRAKVSGECH